MQAVVMIDEEMLRRTLAEEYHLDIPLVSNGDKN